MVLVDTSNPGGIAAEGSSADFGLDGPVPPEVEFVISALEAGPRPAVDRHKVKRTPYRCRATLKLFSDNPEAPPTMLYTRHVNEQAIGVLCAQPLHLSHGGLLRLPGPCGPVMEIYATILRCREVAPGWYEAALYFNREQPLFAADQMQESQPVATK